MFTACKKPSFLFSFLLNLFYYAEEEGKEEEEEEGKGEEGKGEEEEAFIHNIGQQINLQNAYIYISYYLKHYGDLRKLCA